MESASARRIVIATYNVLADVYVRPEFFPLADSSVLASAIRYPRLVERVAGLAADVVCLQEVDNRCFSLLLERLATAGYVGHWARKREGKPDGCATFVRAPWFCRESKILAYRDGSRWRKRSGHIALVTEVERDGWTLMIANTHLKWEAPRTPPERRVGLVQARQLLASSLVRASAASVICGDFNAEPDEPIFGEFLAAGFSDAHPASVATHNADGVARKIDYLMHSSPLAAAPSPPPRIEDSTPLPSETEPSDHLPLVASFRLVTSR